MFIIRNTVIDLETSNHRILAQFYIANRSCQIAKWIHLYIFNPSLTCHHWTDLKDHHKQNPNLEGKRPYKHKFAENGLWGKY